MRRKAKYTDEPVQFGGRVDDVLPPPDQIAKLPVRVNVRLAVSERVIDFFRSHAAVDGSTYQKLMRAALEEYVDRHAGPARQSRQP